jgi:hypothetical protein
MIFKRKFEPRNKYHATVLQSGKMHPSGFHVDSLEALTEWSIKLDFKYVDENETDYLHFAEPYF